MYITVRVCSAAKTTIGETIKTAFKTDMAIKLIMTIKLIVYYLPKIKN